MDQQLTHSLRTAEFVIQALRDAGIDETDPDFETLVMSECDALDRLRSIIRAAQFAEANAGMLKNMGDDLKARRERFLAKAETLRTIVKSAMEQLPLKRLDAPDFTASIAATAPHVVIKDENEIPSQLCTFTVTPDKAAIKAALKQGETVPGAHLSAPGSSITVRVR